MSITKDTLRSVAIETSKLDAPELGGDGHIFIRKLSVKGREDWEQWCDEAQRNGVGAAIAKYGFRAYLLARTLCDEFGVLLFEDPAEGVTVISECPADVMDRIYDAAVAFNNLTKEAQEELEGNSQSGPSDDAL